MSKPHSYSRRQAIRRAIRLFPLFLLIIAACGGYKQFEKSDYDLGSQNEAQKRSGETRAYGFTMKGDGYNHHANENIEFSQPAANAVMEIPGVAQAFVVSTNVNAYVAVVLDDTATGWQSSGEKADKPNNVGTSNGQYDAKDGSDELNPRHLVGDSNTYSTADQPGDITHELKQKIAIAVRNALPHAWEVFISANRDFVNQMNELAQKDWLGQNLNDEVAAFNALAAKFFSELEEQ